MTTQIEPKKPHRLAAGGVALLMMLLALSLWTIIPLFVFLKSRQRGFLGGGTIRWNFTKFLVDRHGEVVARFGSTTKPAAIEPRVAELLG